MTDNLQTAVHELLHVHSAAIKQDKLDALQSDCQSLNVDQKRIVDKVVKAVSEEEEEPIRLIVSGQGGTGKSIVIDVIHRLVSAQTPDNTLRVVVCCSYRACCFIEYPVYLLNMGNQLTTKIKIKN